MATAQPPPRTDPRSEPTLGALVRDMTEQLTSLIRGEIRALEGLKEDVATVKGNRRA